MSELSQEGPLPVEEGTQNEIISLVAHELKNPLVSIKGYAEILLTGAAGDLNHQQTGFLKTIISNTERMAELILSRVAGIDSVPVGQPPGVYCFKGRRRMGRD